jgi:hypothetical protein
MTILTNSPEEFENPEAPETPQNPEAAEVSKPTKPAKKPRKRKKLWVRIILFTLRLLLVPVLCLCALYVGLVIGYVRIGQQPYSDIFDMATWKHLYELVYSKS